MYSAQGLSHKTRNSLVTLCMVASAGILLSGCGFMAQKQEKPLAAYNGEHVLVMLPTSSTYKKAGAAVKAGIEAANAIDSKAAQGAGDQAAKLAFIDSSKRGFNKEYMRTEAQLAIGPLVKASVDLIAADVRVPTLALNRGDTGGSNLLFEYSLSPLDEARDVAAKVAQAGKKHVVVFAPKEKWTNRILEPFASRLNQLDKTIEMETVYLSAKGVVSDKIAAAALSVDTVDAAVVIATPKQARALVPAIKQIAPGLPIIATSHLFEGEPVKSLRDVFIVDIPWMLQKERRDDFKPGAKNYTGSYARLYAMGVDAYRLAPSMTGVMQEAVVYAGETGKITLQKNGIISRELSLGQIQDNGLPLLVPIDALTEAGRSPAKQAKGDQ